MITPIEIIQQHLRTHLDLPVVSKVPEPRPDLFIRIDMAAPQRINLAQYQTGIIVQVYGQSLDETIDTLFHTHQILETIVYRDDVSGWAETTGPHEFPDPDIETFRWQLTGQLTHTI